MPRVRLYIISDLELCKLH